MEPRISTSVKTHDTQMIDFFDDCVRKGVMTNNQKDTVVKYFMNHKNTDLETIFKNSIFEMSGVDKAKFFAKVITSPAFNAEIKDDKVTKENFRILVSSLIDEKKCTSREAIYFIYDLLIEKSEEKIYDLLNKLDDDVKERVITTLLPLNSSSSKTVLIEILQQDVLQDVISLAQKEGLISTLNNKPDDEDSSHYFSRVFGSTLNDKVDLDQLIPSSGTLSAKEDHKSESNKVGSMARFTKTEPYVLVHATENIEVNRMMGVIAQALDNYAEEKFDQLVQHDIKHAEKALGRALTKDEEIAVEEKVRKKVESVLSFFVTVDERKSHETPIERIALPFKHLSTTSDPSFIEGTAAFAAHLAKLAFEQHRDNPEQYVSHGFDHSINVANYTLNVIEMNPKIVTAMAEKYQITEGEAIFLLDNLALLHDCGYPCVGCRAKAVHGISGADLVLPMRAMFDKIITSPGTKREELFNDFRNAIMFHSADKIEEKFGAKIHTTMGTFLADPKNIVTVLSNFYDPAKNPHNTPRYATEIFVQNEQQKKELEEALLNSHEHFKQKAGGEVITLPTVNIHLGKFDGRFADLEFNKDKMIGLEYTVTDLLTNPLNMIRLVDNMDMRKTRLTPTQNEPAFRDVYASLGDQQEISQLAINFEESERRMDSRIRALANNDEEKKTQILAEFAEETQSIFTEYLASSSKEGDFLANEMRRRISESPLTEISTPKAARALLNRLLIDSIFMQEHIANLDKDIKEEVRYIGMQQSSYDFRHFGGTEAVREVKLTGIKPLEGEDLIPCVVVTVDLKLFNELNAVKVSEEGVKVGVGEYQIWRASDAYKSIALGSINIGLRVVDTDNQEVKCIIDAK